LTVPPALLVSVGVASVPPRSATVLPEALLTGTSNTTAPEALTVMLPVLFTVVASTNRFVPTRFCRVPLLLSVCPGIPTTRLPLLDCRIPMLLTLLRRSPRPLMVPLLVSVPVPDTTTLERLIVPLLTTDPLKTDAAGPASVSVRVALMVRLSPVSSAMSWTTTV
jgi:hypothetical protein